MDKKPRSQTVEDRLAALEKKLDTLLHRPKPRRPSGTPVCMDSAGAAGWLKQYLTAKISKEHFGEFWSL